LETPYNAAPKRTSMSPRSTFVALKILKVRHGKGRIIGKQYHLMSFSPPRHQPAPEPPPREGTNPPLPSESTDIETSRKSMRAKAQWEW
jgi:hypothetical protein